MPLKHRHWGILLAGALLITTLAAAQDAERLYAVGAGPVEVTIFTDYFCPPCHRVEPYLDEALAALQRVGARIRFVDKPIYDSSPLFSKYFLYAANALQEPDLAALLRIRRVLFEIAESGAVDSESDLFKAMKERSLPLALFDLRPVFEDWAKLLRQLDVTSTPTCIVTAPGRPEERLSGSNGITQGLDRLLAELTGDQATESQPVPF